MKIRRKLVIDVTYDKVEEQDIKELEENLNFVASHAMGEGLLTEGVGQVEVDAHIVSISELDPLEGKVKKQGGSIELLKDGFVRGTVKVDVSSLLDDDKILEYFLNLLSEKLTNSELLCDIKYQVVDVEDGSVLVVEVEGDPSMIESGPVAELKKES